MFYPEPCTLNTAAESFFLFRFYVSESLNYSINITRIDQDLRKNGFCFSGNNFNMGYEIETQKFIELLYFSGILTIRNVENEYGKSPVINLRLANAYVTELWQNAAGI